MANDTPEINGLAASAGAERSATAALVADLRFPLKVGEFQIDERGRIQARDGTAPLRFGFAYRGVEYNAEVEAANEPRVRLTANLGRLPYSMEIGEGRHLVRRILRESARVPHGRIDLSQTDEMRLEATSTPPEPFTPASLMATLTALLFDFQPYLELLARVLDETRAHHESEAIAPV